jgi:hypothetical protein
MIDDAKKCTGCGSANLASGFTKGGINQKFWVQSSRFGSRSRPLAVNGKSHPDPSSLVTVCRQKLIDR